MVSLTHPLFQAALEVGQLHTEPTLASLGELQVLQMPFSLLLQFRKVNFAFLGSCKVGLKLLYFCIGGYLLAAKLTELFQLLPTLLLYVCKADLFALGL